MNLLDDLLKEHSKAQCSRIVQWVGRSQDRFDTLFNLYMTGDHRTTKRAAWAMADCIMAHPPFIEKKMGQLLDKLAEPGIHDAVKRNTVRILQQVSIPKPYHGRVLTLCFNFVESPTEAVAIKALSLTVLGNLAKHYPDIIPEIKLLINEQFRQQTPAFKSRATKVLKQFGGSDIFFMHDADR